MKYILTFALSMFLIVACHEHPSHTHEHSHEHSHEQYKSDYTTFIYTIDENSWFEYDESPGYYAEVIAEEITYDILDFGYFLTYLNIGTERDPNYIELPQTQVYTDENGITYSIEIVPNYSLGRVRIEYFDTHPDGVIFPQIDYSFRTVIISEPYIINGIKSGEISTDYESVVNEIQKNNIEVNTIDYQ